MPDDPKIPGYVPCSGHWKGDAHLVGDLFGSIVTTDAGEMLILVIDGQGLAFDAPATQALLTIVKDAAERGSMGRLLTPEEAKEMRAARDTEEIV